MESGAFSAASLVEDVLQQHGHRLKDLDLEFRKAEEAASRRYEAAGWLRKIIGVVAAKDLPAEPSEQEFRLVLRSGIILCNAINKVQSGAVPKVVESPVDSALIPNGAPLSAYQYFENVRNFMVAVQEIGLPTFEPSDLEQGGKSSRIVNCVLALKSYCEWKQNGANGAWKFGGNPKPNISAKSFVRKNSDPFTNSLSRTSSINEKTLATLNSDVESSKMSGSLSLSMLVHSILSDKKPEEIPMLVESVLNKVVEEFEHRIASQGEQAKITLRDHVSQRNGSASKFDKKVENKIHMVAKKEDIHKNRVAAEELQTKHLNQKMLFDQQQRDIQELKLTLHTTKAGMQFMQMKFRDEFSNLGMHIHGLAKAASGYHRVLEENRKLYNEVQDLKGSIRVYCRIRPFFPGQPNQLSAVENIEDGTITVSIPSRNGKGQRSFNFNKVFGPSATQAEVFLDMQPLIRSVLDGYNVCIFAYGQTGSGKTYTMTGPKEITEKSQEIHSSSHKGLSVPDASLVPVSSTIDVIELMNLGHRNRAVGATALNDRSSRSHSCLTVHVQGRDLASGATIRGCMHLVDLAGSERVDKSEATGDRLKEAQHINKSLSALGDVIASLAHKNSHIPYRNSKLTQLLQDSLGGQAKTLMFVHISPESDAIGETISTLKFAERVATVELGAARVNKDGANVKELKEQIASLKAALARKEGESEHSFSGSSEKYRTKTELSPYHLNQRVVDSGDRFGYRRPMVEVGNIELQSKTILRQKTKSIDFDEISVNSPPWPPVNSLGPNDGEDEKETGSGEWVDKVMVNKLEANKTDNNLLDCWQESNVNLSEAFYQTYLQDSSKMYSEQSYNMFMGGNQFNSIMASDDNMDEIDAATSDSSEPDLLWQFNHSKLTGLTNGIGSKTIMKSVSKPTKSPQLSKSSVHTSLGPSPSLKQSKVVSHKTGRSPAPVDMKRKIGGRK
ncbi:unnamed protein product [Vicia faba]|uniref:Uncharacterized protein n=1 Tax=Vicia faba TaxID=3906 RepID=A0AAV0YGJ6_VICFA|nr:unnamed protein product [Vicia faba]